MSKNVNFDADLPIQHHFGGGTYAKEVRIKAGQTLIQHRHPYEHLSILASGTVDVIVDGHAKRYVGPTCLVIAAQKHHGVKAATNAVWYCIHATTLDDPEEVDEEVRLEPSPLEIKNVALTAQEN